MSQPKIDIDPTAFALKLIETQKKLEAMAVLELASAGEDGRQILIAPDVHGFRVTVRDATATGPILYATIVAAGKLAGIVAPKPEGFEDNIRKAMGELPEKKDPTQ